MIYVYSIVPTSKRGDTRLAFSTNNEHLPMTRALGKLANFRDEKGFSLVRTTINKVNGRIAGQPEYLAMTYWDSYDIDTAYFIPQLCLDYQSPVIGRYGYRSSVQNQMVSIFMNLNDSTQNRLLINFRGTLRGEKSIVTKAFIVSREYPDEYSFDDMIPVFSANLINPKTRLPDFNISINGVVETMDIEKLKKPIIPNTLLSSDVKRMINPAGSLNMVEYQSYLELRKWCLDWWTNFLIYYSIKANRS